MSELPKGWAHTGLLDVTSVKTGKVDANHASVFGDFTFFTCALEPLKADTYSFEGELIILPGNGANVGHVAFYDGKIEAYQRTYILYNIKIHSKYLYWELKESWRRSNFDKQYGSATNYLKIGNFKNYSLAIAPLNEQIRIANKLDSLLAKVEATQKHLDKIPTLLKRFRQSVLAAAVSGELTKEFGSNELSKQGFPKRWSLKSFKEIGVLERGKSKHRPRNDPKLYGGEYPFIQTGAVAQSDGWIKSHKTTYNELGLSQSKLFPKDTLCITIAANIANTAILTYPACFPDSIVAFRADKNECEVIYIKYLIDVFKDDLELLAPATAQKNINLGILNSMELPIPDSKEQKQIVKRVEALFTLADKVEQQYQAAKQRTDRLTQSILAKAFRGELVPQDPNDEPASELLKRIQADKT